MAAQQHMLQVTTPATRWGCEARISRQPQTWALHRGQSTRAAAARRGSARRRRGRVPGWETHSSSSASRLGFLPGGAPSSCGASACDASERLRRGDPQLRRYVGLRLRVAKVQVGDGRAVRWDRRQRLEAQEALRQENTTNRKASTYAWPEPCCDLDERREGLELIGYTCASRLRATVACQGGYEECNNRK